MSSTIFPAHAAWWMRNVLAGCLLVVSWNVGHSQDPIPRGLASDYVPPPPRQQAPRKAIKLPVEPGTVEVAFTDGSNLKLLLRDEKIALVTPHGKLLLAVADIQRIEFASRISDEDAKRIDAAIADLGSSEYRKREAASAALLKLGAKAYLALQSAAERKDAEVVRRANELLKQITAAVPAEHLTIRKNDVIYTADSMIAGRIEGASLKVHTSQFGVLQVKLADVRSLRSPASDPEPVRLQSTTATPMTPAPTVAPR